MEQIVSLCNKIIEETTTKINQSGSIITQDLKKKEFKETNKKKFTTRETTTKKILHNAFSEELKQLQLTH